MTVKHLPISELSFNQDDGNLFLVDDLRLRADALKHSVLPRLQRLTHEAIDGVRNILGVEILEDSIVSQSPNFRMKRENDLKIDYGAAIVGIGGKRKPQWPGFKRRNGESVHIPPFLFEFQLDENGVRACLRNGWLTGLDDSAYRAILQFHIDNEAQINSLCFESGIRPLRDFAKDIRYLSPLARQYEYRIEHRLFENSFHGHTFHFPIGTPQINELIDSFVTFFPVYDSYIQIAKDLAPRLEELTNKLSDCFERNNEEIVKVGQLSPDQLVNANQLAAKKIRVMPAIRWTVFQRDDWKCVACGRSALENTILHVDHVVPRSIGGSDKLENFQTLCQACNLGKSNRDSTSLRVRV